MSEGLRADGWSGVWVTAHVPGVHCWGSVSVCEGASGPGRDLRQAESLCWYLVWGICGRSVRVLMFAASTQLHQLASWGPVGQIRGFGIQAEVPVV